MLLRAEEKTEDRELQGVSKEGHSSTEAGRGTLTKNPMFDQGPQES